VTLLLPQDLGNDLHNTKKGGPTSFIILYYNSTSHFPMTKTLIPLFFLEPVSLSSHLCTIFKCPYAHHTLPLFPSSTRLCVAQIPSPWSSMKALQMGYPIPSLNLDDVFPPTSLTVIHFWMRGLF